MLQYNPTVSGSLTITGSLTVTNGVIGTVSGVDVQIFSSSINQVISGIQSVTGSYETIGRGIVSGSSQLTSSYDTRYVVSGSITQTTWDNIASKPSGIVSGSSQVIDILTSLNSTTASFTPRISNLESKSSSVDISISNINSVTASNIARLSNLETKSASVDISITNINSKTGSYATTGSNTFFGTQTYSGSVYIANDLIVQGSSSIQYISASSVSIGTNIIQLNTANPSVRFAGLTIIDSGSIGGSGSFLYDSVHDEFVFVHRGNGTNVTSSHFVLGPETYDSLGNETYLTTNILSKGTGKEHLVDSCIFDNGTTTCIKNNLVGTGTMSGTTIYGSTNVCSPIGLFSGCVGIGITSPAKTLHVVNTDYQLRLAYDTSNTVYSDFKNDSAGGLLINTSAGYIINYIGGSAKMRIDTSAICFSSIVCTPYVSTNTIDVGGSATGPTQACIGYGMFGYSGVGLAISAGASGPNQGIGFFVCGVERGRWITNGNLGIGTVCPSYNLHICSTSGNTILGVQDTCAGGAARLYLVNASRSMFITNNSSDCLLSLYYAGTNRMQFDLTNQWFNSGCLGIGTTSPSTPLHVCSSGNQIARFVSTYSLTGGYSDFFTLLSSNQTGGGLSFNIGKSEASYNLGKIVFNYIGDQSTSNNLAFGFYNYDNKLVIVADGTVRPGANGTQNLGSASYRWCTIYTSDLSLSNGIGDYTIVEGESDLFLYNNKQCKVYKFMLQQVCTECAPAKMS